jgi:YfiH family protein
MTAELILPYWPAPANVRGLVTTRALGDMKTKEGRDKLRRHLPSDPVWLRQVHGVHAVDAARTPAGAAADASYTTQANVVCIAMAADCMPVLLAEEGGGAVGIAHAGWRGLAAGVVEATVDAMGVPAARILAWLGPAIGPEKYEIGEEVRDAFLQRDAKAAPAFTPTRPGHWLLDLYLIARQRLAARGIARVTGGGFCTASDGARFFSYRRDRASERMAAAIWLQSPPR